MRTVTAGKLPVCVEGKKGGGNEVKEGVVKNGRGGEVGGGGGGE